MTQQITAQLLKGGLTVDASGNVTATGRFSGPTQRIGTIKAQDGTTAITIADSTGVVTVTSPVINTGVSGSAILDEDAMGSNSDTKLATQQSIKAYVDAAGIPGISSTGSSSSDTVTIAGHLTVDGLTTIINSTTLSVDDKNIELGSVASPDDTTANGGGITLKGATDKTILWTNSTDSWDFNQGITTSGIVTATGGTSTNWNTAYGWGDHSGAGYATSGGAITVSTINGTEIVAGTNGNLGVGITTLDSLTSGHNNVGAGDNALTSCTDGYQNTAIGSYAMENTTSANQNAAAGFCALRLNETGERNTAMGAKALRSLATGDFNTAVGYYALYLTNGANWNTALGFDAGKSIVGGNNNTILGAKAGDNITSGSSNIIIGYNIDADSATGSNQLNIGNTIYGDLSTGNVGIGVSPSYKLHSKVTANDWNLVAERDSGPKGGWWMNTTDAEFGTITSHDLGFAIGGSKKMTIDTSGHVYPAGNGSQDLGGTGARWANIYVANMHLSNIEGSTHYRSIFYTVFPFYGASNSLNASSTSWALVCALNGEWNNGRSIFASGKLMDSPPSGFTEQLWLHITGGPGSDGTASLRWKFEFNSGVSIAERTVVTGWHGANQSFHDSAQIADVSSTSLRSFLTSGSNNYGNVYFRNGGSAGNVGVSRVWLEQKILFS